jgi:hypothetical protein
MNAPPFPTNPHVGQYCGNWVWSGSRWTCTAGAGTRVITKVFPTSAPYTPSPGLITAVVETLGAGGGGGGVLESAGWNGGGGGGGSGGYSKVTLAAALVLGGVNVTIGAGGTSTAIPGLTPPQAGSTSFGGLCLAYGGWGGVTIGNPIAGLGQTGEGGLAAQAGIGDLALPGNAGWQGSYANVGTFTPPLGAMYGGRGGAPPMLGGGVPRSAVIFDDGFMAGYDPYVGPAGPGVGGAGGVSWAAAGDIGGGTGGSGLCVVTEYCWSDTGDAGCGCGTTMSGARVAIPTGQHGWGYEND